MRFKLAIVLIMIANSMLAQVGGERTYEFLNISTNAKTSALGGQIISLKSNDLGIAAHNPSLLDSSYNNSVELTRASLFESETDISNWNLVYVNQYKKYNYLISGHFVRYGQFDGYDEDGISIGSFSANDYVLTAAVARQVCNRITIGASIKPIYSEMESYKSFAIATDWSATFSDTARLFAISLLMRNVGLQIKPYTSGNRESLPWGIDFGYSQKLRHAPLRVSLTLHDLQTFDTHYSEPKTNKNEKDDSNFEKFSKNMLSHIIVGGELLLFKNMYAALSYNFKRSREMDFEDCSKVNGLSFGFGLKVYKFYISYGHENYHSAGATNVFTFRANIDEFHKR